jgi:hypothetical protein
MAEPLRTVVSCQLPRSADDAARVPDADEPDEPSSPHDTITSEPVSTTTIKPNVRIRMA